MEWTIYYFSAGGNTLKLARDLQKGLGDCDIIPILRFKDAEAVTCDSKKIIFLYPVYWLGPPNFVKEFALKLKLADCEYLAAINTYGLLNGSSQYVFNQWLGKAGYSLNYSASVWMPGNNQRDFPVFPGFLVKLIGARYKVKLPRLLKDLTRFKCVPIKTDIRYSRTSLEKVYFKEYYDKIKEGGKIFYTTEECTGCGICEKICPVESISIEPGKAVWKDECSLCMSCYDWCPGNAVRMKNVPEKRGRYRNPEVSLKEMLNQKEKRVRC